MINENRTPRCAFCDDECSEEQHCRGCGSYICDDCDFGAPTNGAHDTEDHGPDDSSEGA